MAGATIIKWYVVDLLSYPASSSILSIRFPQQVRYYNKQYHTPKRRGHMLVQPI